MTVLAALFFPTGWLRVQPSAQQPTAAASLAQSVRLRACTAAPVAPSIPINFWLLVQGDGPPPPDDVSLCGRCCENHCAGDAAAVERDLAALSARAAAVELLGAARTFQLPGAGLARRLCSSTSSPALRLASASARFANALASSTDFSCRARSCSSSSSNRSRCFTRSLSWRTSISRRRAAPAAAMVPLDSLLRLLDCMLLLLLSNAEAAAIDRAAAVRRHTVTFNHAGPIDARSTSHNALTVGNV